MEKYYKNFILCGEANFFCILCQEGFENKIHVEKHMRWENHRNSLKQQEYFYKFRKDNIYKIPGGHFYCEICNFVIQNAPLHIKDNDHQELKKCNKIKVRTSNVLRDENGSIKINNRVITKPQWHGIVDNMCYTCDERLERILTHMKCFDHMIRIIQTETMFKDNELCRQVGPNDFYCFSCFKVFNSKSLERHCVDKHNRKDKNLSQDINKKKIITKTNLDTNNDIDVTDLDILKRIEKKYFSFEIENKATCLDCQEIVDATFKSVYQHKKSHQSPEDIIEADLTWLRQDKGKTRAELAKYGRDNFISLNEGGSKGYCSLCNISLSAHINIAKQHVEGALHRGYLELKGLIKDQKHEKPTVKPVPYKKFLEVMCGPFEIDDASFVCINNGICIDLFSFMLICATDNFKRIIKCFGCDLTLDWKNFKEHIETPEHVKILHGCKVLPMVMKDCDEFIRQIHPGLYHCGYCNKSFPFWENLMKHLKSLRHSVQYQKAKLISLVCAKLYLDPSCPLEDIEEYEAINNFFGRLYF